MRAEDRDHAEHASERSVAVKAAVEVPGSKRDYVTFFVSDETWQWLWLSHSAIHGIELIVGAAVAAHGQGCVTDEAVTPRKSMFADLLRDSVQSRKTSVSIASSIASRALYYFFRPPISFTLNPTIHV